jgi:DnaJ-class molecular chaperone
MTDPYQTLGVAKTASQADITKAYRKLAKELHPDLHPGDKKAEERFKEVSAAYSLLSDADKRKRFDAGEIDAQGHERPEHQFYRAYADGNQGAKYAQGGDFGGFDDLGDVFADLFSGRGGGRGGSRGNFQARGADVSYTLRASFLEAANGAKKRITMPDGKALDLNIPAGLKDRQTLRLKGQGQPGFGGGPPGDAYVEIVIEPHAFFTRKDNDVHVTLPVSLAEAVLGAKVETPTVSGNVTLTVPKGSNTGTQLRLKGKGIIDPASGQRGDQYVRLQVMLPEAPDPALEAFVQEWPGRDYDARQKFREAG